MASGRLSHYKLIQFFIVFTLFSFLHSILKNIEKKKKIRILKEGRKREREEKKEERKRRKNQQLLYIVRDFILFLISKTAPPITLFSNVLS